MMKMKSFTIAVVGVIVAFGVLPARADAGCKFWDCIAAPFKAAEWVIEKVIIEPITVVGDEVTETICDFVGAGNCNIGVGVNRDSEGDWNLTDGDGQPADAPQQTEDTSSGEDDPALDVQQPPPSVANAGAGGAPAGWDPEWGPLPSEAVDRRLAQVEPCCFDEFGEFRLEWAIEHDLDVRHAEATEALEATGVGVWDGIEEVGQAYSEAKAVLEPAGDILRGKPWKPTLDLLLWIPDANPPGEMEEMLEHHRRLLEQVRVPNATPSEPNK